jgi:hypothetical protein
MSETEEPVRTETTPVVPRRPPTNPPGRPPGIPQLNPLMSAMLYVSRNPPGEGDVGLRVVCRKFLDEKPADFIKQLAGLQGERTRQLEVLKSKPKEEAQVTVVQDEGDAALGEMIDQLLGEFKR